jgi:FKBP-type peptidyl-prolyl cis-trans isomerase SlyD
MKIDTNKMVSLIYELREKDSEGRVIEKLDETKPLQFVFGTGRLLPVFESNIDSLKSGDLFNFTLDSNKAYGEKREDMIIDVPISVFETDGKVNEDICRVGNEVPMMDTEGNPLNGVINEITDTYVKMDFNHPMAGIDLFFTGRILEVRDATDQELMPAGSCSGCGSHSNSGCGSSSDSGCCSSSDSGCGGSCS